MTLKLHLCHWVAIRSPFVVALTASLLSCGWVAPAMSQTGGDKDKGEWPQMLGPQRNGISTETGLLDGWSANGPKEVWRVTGGVGMSGLAISRGTLTTLVQKESRQWLVAIDAKTGKAKWQTDLAPEFENPMGNGPRGTPMIAGDLVFAFTGEGVLAAVKFADGTPVWSHNVVKELKGKIAEYGMACSPIVVGDQVIVTVGAPQATVVAFDTKSGRQAWASGSDVAGYSSPAMRNIGGRSQLVVFTGRSALGLNPADGANLWRYPYQTNYESNIAVPLSIDGDVFLSSGENHGSVRLSLKPRGEKFDLSEVWSSQGPRSVLRNEWQTSILLDGHLYGMDNVGGAGPVTHLTCVNAKTGERVWQQPRFGKGNLIAADGKLWISTRRSRRNSRRSMIRRSTCVGATTAAATDRASSRDRCLHCGLVRDCEY